MARKVILIADPGIDTAFAIALALHDPNLDVIGLIPCAGNVSATQAAANVQILIDQFDPRKWPRTSAPIAVEYELNGTDMHGVDGLGGLNLPQTDRHSPLPAEKAISELVRQHPREVSIICLGPVTTVARAFDRDPDLPSLLDKLVMVGGCWNEPGNAGPVSEFHFYLDPEATRRVLRSGVHPDIIPLEITRRLILSPTELLELPNPDSRTSSFLRKIVPYALRTSSHLYGIEGFHLKDVLGVAALALPGAITLAEHHIDIETKGELTRGMMVVDTRKKRSRPNAQLGIETAIGEIRQYIERILRQAP